MRNPFRRNKEGFPGPSLRPSNPPSAEMPMESPEYMDMPVNKPTAPPSAEKPMRSPKSKR